MLFGHSAEVEGGMHGLLTEWGTAPRCNNKAGTQADADLSSSTATESTGHHKHGVHKDEGTEEQFPPINASSEHLNHHIYLPLYADGAQKRQALANS